jgi:hypothetical protein
VTDSAIEAAARRYIAQHDYAMTLSILTDAGRRAQSDAIDARADLRRAVKEAGGRD